MKALFFSLLLGSLASVGLWGTSLGAEPPLEVKSPVPIDEEPLARLDDTWPEKSRRKKANETVSKKRNVRPADLAGEWRVFLPAGFEHEITLVAGEKGEYHLTPGHLTFQGTYQVQEGQLVGEKMAKYGDGQFIWKVHSPYFITLIKQTAGVGSDYTGAVMFRNRDSVKPSQKR